MQVLSTSFAPEILEGHHAFQIMFYFIDTVSKLVKITAWSQNLILMYVTNTTTIPFKDIEARV